MFISGDEVNFRLCLSQVAMQTSHYAYPGGHCLTSKRKHRPYSTKLCKELPGCGWLCIFSLILRKSKRRGAYERKHKPFSFGVDRIAAIRRLSESTRTECPMLNWLPYDNHFPPFCVIQKRSSPNYNRARTILLDIRMITPPLTLLPLQVLHQRVFCH